MPRYAAIDVGTNTVLLTIAQVADGVITPLLERAVITRLGQGVDASRTLSTAARERTLRCLTDMASLIRDAGVERVVAVGTSALRDANGGADFLDQAASVLGTRPVVVPGNLEAELTFEGAISGMALQGPVLVFDIGGGSTELISGMAQVSEHPNGLEHSLAWSVSLDFGSVRLFERCVRSDPPTHEQLEEVRHIARAALAGLPAPQRGARLVGVAGTVTTLAALSAHAVDHQPGRLHGTTLSSNEVRELASRLSGLTVAERSKLPALEPGRADVIVVGALLVAEVLAWAQARELLVSDRGVRWGLLRRLAAKQPLF